MKYTIIVIVLIWCNITNAQSYVEDNLQVHSYSSKIVELNYLITEHGQGGEGIISETNSKGLIKQYCLSYDNGEFSATQTKYNIYALQHIILKSFYNKDNENVYFNVGGGGYLSYETMKNSILDEKKNKFSPGILAKIELEFYINKIGIGINVQQLYKPISEIGIWQWRIGIGVKYVLK